MTEYESPIHVQLQQAMDEWVEDQLTVKISQAMGIEIDRERLKSALAHDRHSWYAGYNEGKKAVDRKGSWLQIYNYSDSHTGWLCSECSGMTYTIDVDDKPTYCSCCGARNGA